MMMVIRMMNILSSEDRVVGGGSEEDEELRCCVVGVCEMSWAMLLAMVSYREEEPTTPAESHTSKIMERSILTSHYH